MAPVCLRASRCEGVRAPGCALASVGAVGVGGRALRSPAESRRPAPQPAPECRCLQLSQGVAGAGRALEGGPPAGLSLQWHAMAMWLEDDSFPMRTPEAMCA